MEELEISEMLVPKKIEIDNIYLDPSNPRLLLELEEKPAGPVTDTDVQSQILQTMKKRKFAVQQLVKSILENGFLPVDNIVVKEIEDEPGKYVVIEGNRRIAAAKLILQKYGKLGERYEPRISQLKEFDVLVLNLDECDDPSLVVTTVRGVRNISGLREWGAFEKSTAIKEMADAGISSRRIGDILGMSTRMVNRYLKAYNALQAMREDEEYEEEWDPNLFTYFDEAIKRPPVRKWLDWDEGEMAFKNMENLKLFYDWIVPNENGMKKIGEAKQVRLLAEILSSERKERYLDMLVEENRSMSRVHDKLLRDRAKKEAFEVDWTERIKDFMRTLNMLPASYLHKLKKDEMDSFEDLQSKVNEVVEIIRRLKG